MEGKTAQEPLKIRRTETGFFRFHRICPAGLTFRMPHNSTFFSTKRLVSFIIGRMGAGTIVGLATTVYGNGRGYPNNDSL